MCGQHYLARVHPDDLPRVREAFQFALDHPERTVQIQFRHQKRIRSVAALGTGRPVGCLVSVGSGLRVRITQNNLVVVGGCRRGT